MRAMLMANNPNQRPTRRPLAQTCRASIVGTMRVPPSSNHPLPWTLLRWLRGPYPYLDELVRKHGETFRLDFGQQRLVMFSNPEHIKEIFADGGDELEAGRFNRLIAPLL